MNFTFKPFVMVGVTLSLAALTVGCSPLSLVTIGSPALTVHSHIRGYQIDSKAKEHKKKLDRIANDRSYASPKIKLDKIHTSGKGTLFTSALKVKNDHYTFQAKNDFSVLNAQNNKVLLNFSAGQKLYSLKNPVKVEGNFYPVICLADCYGKKDSIVGLVSVKGILQQKLYSMAADNPYSVSVNETLKLSTKSVSFTSKVKTTIETLPNTSQTLEYVGDVNSIPKIELAQHTNSQGERNADSVVLFTINAENGILYPCGNKCAFKIASKSSDTVRFIVHKN